MTAEPAQTPAAVRAAAEARVKAREDGIRAQAIGEGRRLERQELLTQLGAQAVEDVGLIAAVREEHAHAILDMRRQFEREEAKHGAFRFWKGAAIGLLLGACIGTAATFVVIDQGQKAAFDAATDATARGVIVDRASRAAEQPQASD